MEILLHNDSLCFFGGGYVMINLFVGCWNPRLSQTNILVLAWASFLLPTLSCLPQCWQDLLWVCPCAGSNKTEEEVWRSLSKRDKLAGSANFFLGSTGTSSSRRLGAFSARKSAPSRLSSSSKKTIPFRQRAQAMEEESQIPSWGISSGKDRLKTFCPFPRSCIDLPRFGKKPKKLQPSWSLPSFSLVDILGFSWTRPNHRPLHKLISSIDPLSALLPSCQGNKPSTLPSRGRRVEVYEKHTSKLLTTIVWSQVENGLKSTSMQHAWWNWMERTQVLSWSLCLIRISGIKIPRCKI